MSKVHCENQDETGFTNCGISEKRVFIVGGWIFDKLKDRYKCQRCKRIEDKRK